MTEEANNTEQPQEAAEATETPQRSEPTIADLSAALAMQGQLLQDLLTERKTAAETAATAAAAEEEKQAASLPEADKLRRERELMEAERKAWKIQREEFAGAELQRAQTAALDKLGVLPQYREIVPQSLDPRTPEGAADLEKFFSDKPALLRSKEIAEAAKPAKMSIPRALFGSNGKSANGLTNLAAIAANAKQQGFDI